MARKETIDRARGLRRELTGAERKLWRMLRDRRFEGVKFRRQHPIGPFIVDFYCHETGLIIELDGMSHDGRAREDERRTAYLQRQSLRVRRILNDEVLNDLEAVLDGILVACGFDLETGQRNSLE